MREKISKEAILKLLSEEQIMEYYLGIDVQYEKPFTNPLREDSSPGCWFRKGKLLRITDYARPDLNGDCFQQVKLKFSVDFHEALRIINKDFKLGLDDGYLLDYVPVISPYVSPGVIPPERVEKRITFIEMEFTELDIFFWELFGSNISLLEEYNVKRTKKLWIDGELNYSNEFRNPCFVYDNKSHKIVYRPFSKTKKWRQNRGEFPDNIQGWSQLEDKGEEIFITSSTKDIMTLRGIGIRNSIAVGSEPPKVSDVISEEIEKRFNEIYVWYDNDETGVRNSILLTGSKGWKYVNTPKGSPKDPSDFYRIMGKEKLISFSKSKGLCLK